MIFLSQYKINKTRSILHYPYPTINTQRIPFFSLKESNNIHEFTEQHLNVSHVISTYCLTSMAHTVHTDTTFSTKPPLDAVRELIPKLSNKCINKKSWSEPCYYVRLEKMDLLYANAKGLIQSGRI